MAEEMHDDEVRRQQDALAAQLRRALAETGLDSTDDVFELLRQKRVSISQSTVARYWNGQLPTEDKTASRRALEAIADLTEDKDAIMLAWRDLVQTATGLRSGRRDTGSGHISDNSATTSKWLQVIPRQDTRTYTSVDLVEFTREEDAIEGTFLRLFPREEAGYNWNIRGYAQGDDAFHYAFSAHDETGAISVGAMSLMVSGFRPRSYRGGYSRRDLPVGGEWVLINREVEWYKRLPSRYLSSVALLDFDNTLRSGWTLVSLATSDAFQELDGIEGFRAEVDSARTAHRDQAAGHDEFATRTAEAYARLAARNTQRALEQAASTYVHLEVRRTLFEFARPLIATLRDRDIAPILVTGVPVELARQIAAELGVEEVHGLEVADGFITRNTGTAEGKREVVSRLARASREIVFAAGDSESDLPLMTFASVRLAAAGLVSAHASLGGDDTYEFGPDSEWAPLESWLTERLPSPYFPRLS